MIDCEIFGFKHSLYIYDAVDQFLFGYVHFKCRRCEAQVRVDRLYLYLAMQIPGRSDPWR